MPKNFVFYNPEEHQRIISVLESSGVKAIICATGRNPALAGGVYPFPLIEDGDFNIPSVYMTEDEAARILPYVGKKVFLQFGISAIAVSSKWFIDNINGQDITHTPKDNVEIVDCNKLVEISHALNTLIRSL